ncbi:sugar-binding domain-containing protein [Viscerimonas tarda]
MKSLNIFNRAAYMSVGVLILLFLCFPANGQNVRKITGIDKDWKFHLGDVENGQLVNFDDSNWRKLDVPHDWSIEGDYDQNAITKRGGGYLPAGIGWYRKTISLPKSDSGKRVFVEFGGIMANSDVWINGHLLGHHPFGYVPLVYDLTDYITFDGKANILAVKADNTVQPASRWYTGAGIYRHVELFTVAQTQLDRYGVFITTPEASHEKATVAVQASVSNKSKASRTLLVQTTISSPSGKSFKSEPSSVTVGAGETIVCDQTIAVPSPELWDISAPNIYTALTTLSDGKKVVDDQKNTFGIRFFSFESETGFWLNGKNIKLLGACVHHDGGALGSAVPASVWERRFERLKAVGCNAIRGAHAPMDPAFYELCDKMGLLLLDEVFDTWTAAKPNGEKAYNLYFNEWWNIDTSIALKRVRNHPSIVLYSLGNEIRDNVNSPEGRQRFLDLRALTKSIDSSRPITMALFRAKMMGLYENGFSEMLDVIGQNYAETGLLAAWSEKPGRKIIGTENTPSRSAWLVARDNPAYSGMFIWTGFDYLGEADWPKISWSEALFDRNAGWKHTSWERQSWWTSEPMAHIVRRDTAQRASWLDDWTPAYKLDTAFVNVYSNCEEVELYLNGTSLGKQQTPKDDGPNSWRVVYAPGTIKVIGRNGGKEVAVHEHTTASEPVKLLLETEKKEAINDWEEVVYVTATIVDKNGIRYPNSPSKIKFNISGPGEIVSVDNSNNFSHERYKTNEKTNYKGRAMAIIRATASSGAIKLTASADGLEGASVVIQAVGKK